MRNSNKTLITILIIMLIGSNMAYSSHNANHTLSDSGVCSLCLHQTNSDNALVQQSSGFFAEAPATCPHPGTQTTRFDCAKLFDHQSRAPPFSV